MNKTLILILLLLPIYIRADEPVYFIHGFMRSSSSMGKMAKAFEKEDYETHLWDYPSRRQTIEAHAGLLVVDLQKCALEHEGKPIHFVTHSLGGIVLRAALNHPDCPKEAKIGRAVLLAPPNQGSSFAHYLNNFWLVRKILGPKSGRQLLKSQMFDHLGQFPESLEVLVISGTSGWNPIIKEKNDGKVGVSESRLTTTHEQITVPCGHTWIMRSKTVIRSSLAFISLKETAQIPHQAPYKE
jgi:pimeloyl-ACP methyl ester carboxylesterase